MGTIETSDIITYVEENISTFHDKRIEKLDKLKINNLLRRKNPYLFKAKNIMNSQELVKSLLDAYLSSREETLFGDFLEGLALFICGKVYDGTKSSATGIDLEFTKDGIRYLVSIKSGPNWGNSSQIKKMQDNFKTAKKILCTNSLKINVVAVNGCCYGVDKAPDKGDYYKLCGQEFWSFISGNENLYIDIIEPLGYLAHEKNELFERSYTRILNKFTMKFSEEFCENGEIDWEKLVKFNSSFAQCLNNEEQSEEETLEEEQLEEILN